MRHKPSIDAVQRAIVSDLLAEARQADFYATAGAMFHPHTLLSLAATVVSIGAMLIALTAIA